MKSQAVVKPKRACVLRSVVVGTRRLIVMESLSLALGREPAPDDPVTVTINVNRRSNLTPHRRPILTPLGAGLWR